MKNLKLGFFDIVEGWSVSLIIENYLVEATNALQIREYYPTLGAFGIDKNQKSYIDWVYNMMTSPNKQTYAYPSPSPIENGKPPLPRPSPDFPSVIFLK